MLETVVGAIAAPIFEGLWKLGGDAIADIKTEYKRIGDLNQWLAAVSRYYEEGYRALHREVKPLKDLTKPRDLESIYTVVKLLDSDSIRPFLTEQGLEDIYRAAGRRSFQSLKSDKRLDGLTVAKQEQYLMVLGGPGIGKSTFLKKLGFEALKPGGTHIPVLLELKLFRDKAVDLVGAIATSFETCGFPAAKAFAIRALERGNLLVLLDGLDEVPTQNFNNVADCIEQFVNR